ncbi:hypothetical protein ACLOJK_006996 [Asimina triloba]
MGLDDTTSLFTYAVLRLIPHALSSGTTSWSYLRKGAPPSHIAVASLLASSGISPEELQCTSRDTSPGRQGPGYQVPRPLQRERWSKGKDGFVSTDIRGGEAGNVSSEIPTAWLQQMGERMYLLVYQHKSLTVIVLIPVSSLIGEQGISLVKQQLLEHASLKILKVEERLSRGWGGENAYHVSGYRYLLIDNDRDISRASPLGKVTTLTKDSLLALSKLRQEVDLEKSQARRDDPEHEKDLEVCIRARNNAWIVARIARGKELYMVLEKANETLLYASDAVEKFSNRLWGSKLDKLSKYCDGAFPVD